MGFLLMPRLDRKPAGQFPGAGVPLCSREGEQAPSPFSPRPPSPRAERPQPPSPGAQVCLSREGGPLSACTCVFRSHFRKSSVFRFCFSVFRKESNVLVIFQIIKRPEAEWDMFYVVGKLLSDGGRGTPVNTHHLLGF